MKPLVYGEMSVNSKLSVKSRLVFVFMSSARHVVEQHRRFVGFKRRHGPNQTVKQPLPVFVSVFLMRSAGRRLESNSSSSSLAARSAPLTLFNALVRDVFLELSDSSGGRRTFILP